MSVCVGMCKCLYECMCVCLSIKQVVCVCVYVRVRQEGDVVGASGVQLRRFA